MSKIKFKRDFNVNRSDKYQHFIVESSCSPEVLTEFSESKGMTGYLNMSEYNEEFFSLKEKLHEELWRIMKEVLTPRQLEVIELSAQGLTQIEIAKKLNVNQSSITKSINGNCDYKNGKKVYGGAKKKLKNAVSKDPKIQEILEKISELSQLY